MPLLHISDKACSMSWVNEWLKVCGSSDPNWASFQRSHLTCAASKCSTFRVQSRDLTGYSKCSNAVAAHPRTKGLRKFHSSFGLSGIKEYSGMVIFRSDFQLPLLFKNLPLFCEVMGKVDFFQLIIRHVFFCLCLKMTWLIL